MLLWWRGITARTPISGELVFQLAPHAAAVVHDQTDGHGRVFLTEEPERWPGAVLGDLKILFALGVDETAVAIAHSHRKHHQIDAYGDLVRRRILPPGTAAPA